MLSVLGYLPSDFRILTKKNYVMNLYKEGIYE